MSTHSIRPPRRRSASARCGGCRRARARRDPASDRARSPTPEIFAAALRGPARGPRPATPARSSAPARGRCRPRSAAGRLDGALAPAQRRDGRAGDVRLQRAGRSGAALVGDAALRLRRRPRGAIAGLVRRVPTARSPLVAASARGGLGCHRSRSAAVACGSRANSSGTPTRSGRARRYEDCRGRHIISQGGYYQYGLGFQGAFRDPLQHMLPMIYSDPALARDVLLYSGPGTARVGVRSPTRCPSCASRSSSATPMISTCGYCSRPPSTDWRTRDLHVFNLPVSYAGGGRGTLWSHLKVAFRHQQVAARTARRLRREDTGDWSDLSTTFLGMTESTLVDAQAAYIYPRLAILADVRRRSRFRRAAPARRGGTISGDPSAVDGARLVRPRLRREPPDRDGRDLRRAAAVGDPRRRARARLRPGRWSAGSGAS